MRRFPRTLASLAAVAVLSALAVVVPSAGPLLLAFTVAGVAAAFIEEHARC